MLDQPRDRALTALVDEANRHGAEPSCKRPTQGFPPACIPTCLYLLLTTDSFEEAVTDVINLGGDADTAGAILGAMAGAYYGIDEIPKRWLDGLQNRQGIEARALALARRSGEGLEIPDLVATERELTRKEGEILEQFMSRRPGRGRSRCQPRLLNEPATAADRVATGSARPRCFSASHSAAVRAASLFATAFLR